MATAYKMAQYLLQREPQKNICRLAFYQYLKNHCASKQPLNYGCLDRFFQLALNFDYWRRESKKLCQTVAEDLRNYALDHESSGQWTSLKYPLGLQVVEIEHDENWQNLIKASMPSTTEKKFKFIHISKNRLMVVEKNIHNNLLVKSYSRWALLRDGEVKVIGPLTYLTYNSDLEFEMDEHQYLEISPLTLCRFQVAGGLYSTHFISGHNFQKSDSFTGPLEKHPEMLKSLKFTEHFYINPQSDKYYQELLQFLKKALELVKNQHPQALSIAKEAFRRGEEASRKIFPNDKLIHLLVTQLSQCIGDADKTSNAMTVNKRMSQPCQKIKPINSFD